MDELHNRLDAAITVIRVHVAGKQRVPASDADIESAEKTLGVALPNSYKHFLKQMGLSFWPDYIYGLGAGVLDGLNVVKVTEEERNLLEPPLQHNLVAISPDGWGNNFCLDTSLPVDGECPVVFWNHEKESDQVPEIVGATFVDWLEALIRETLDEERDGSE